MYSQLGARAYLAETLAYRDFWLALSGIDLRNRFRRTALGIAWTIIHPLAFTLILSVMFHALLNQKIEVFSVYVFSGVIFWSWFSDSFLLGATSLLASQGFIRQKRLPLIGFAVRTSVVSLVTYLLSFVGLLIWFLAMGHRPGWMVLMLPVNVALLAFALFPVTVVSGLLGVLYRDFAQAVQIILQALWFVSPVFLDKTVFARPQLRIWNDWNPISSMLSLVRLPLMDDKIPDIGTYMMVLAFAVVFYVWGFHLLRRHEDRIVYYL